MDPAHGRLGRAVALAFNDWRAATPKEISKFLAEKRRRTGHRARGRDNALIVRSRLKPVDVYAYLRTRFGRPNGFQNFLRRDDSDNWIHWDFNIKSRGEDVYIAGASREIHFVLSEALTDPQWKSLINGLQAEFARYGRQKSETVRRFEKFLVFQNKYVALANVCADLHAQIVDAPPLQMNWPIRATRKNAEATYAPLKQAGERADKLYGACVQLALLTPVLAEAYINMFALVLRRPDLRSDRDGYRAFVREYIPDRIGRLHEVCMAMRPVDRRSPAYSQFMTVMNKRNFAIHGNVEPERDALETVYFEGKRPLFSTPGHHLGQFFAHLDQLLRPDTVVQDYEAVHSFLHELTTYLDEDVREFFSNVIDDPYPGLEVRKKRITRILPDQIIMAMPGGMRCDDELRVRW